MDDAERKTTVLAILWLLVSEAFKSVSAVEGLSEAERFVYLNEMMLAGLEGRTFEDIGIDSVLPFRMSDGQ